MFQMIDLPGKNDFVFFRVIKAEEREVGTTLTIGSFVPILCVLCLTLTRGSILVSTYQKRRKGH